ncbi:MAG: transposase family protein [Propionibacteriaceae bacterium]|nr:transposase family protein [Propionibacteriaceae bacterium]
MLSDVSQNLLAGFLLGARAELKPLGLPAPTVPQILTATGAGRSQAYQCKTMILEALPKLQRPTGRPSASAEMPPPATADGELTGAVLKYVMAHPGCVCAGSSRRRYSDDFRRFVLELREQHPDLDRDAVSQATQVPLPTLKEWLRGGSSANTEATEEKKTHTAKRLRAQSSDTEATAATSVHIQTILDEWHGWEGDLSHFVDHLKHNLRIPYGRTFIADTLEQYGVRRAKRRAGRSPDEKALRDSFESFFPGAQWEGDGTPVAVWVGEQRFDFNLELMVDADCGAFVGASLREEEDGQAVVDAFDDGVQTTGASPLAVTLDNRSSNHTAQVAEAFGDTMPIRATKGRPQNKPHVEGAFGLFFQSIPLLAITTDDPQHTAWQLLQIVIQAYSRALNHKPRRDRGGRTRAQLYQEADPTPEQIEEAKAALEQRRRKQDKARETLLARQNPVVRAVLDDAFAKLEFQDSSGNVRAAIARYPLDAVLAGIATYEQRQHTDTLPPNVDGPRYLLGIVRNIATEDEGMRISEALLLKRLDVKDRILEPLRNTHQIIVCAKPQPLDLLKALVIRGLDAQRRIDRLYWLAAVVDLINAQPQGRHTDLVRTAARRIHATHAVAYRDRAAAARFIIERVIPLN